MPMLVVLAGMETLVRPLHEENAKPPIPTTPPAGMVTPVRRRQLENALEAMEVTLEGIVGIPILPIGQWIRMDWFLLHSIPSAWL